jgi:uncharacterized membrane protein
MKTIANTFLKGLLFTLPIVFTFGLLTWLFLTAERLLRVPLEWVLPPGWYIAGMGVASSAIIIFLLGILVQAYLIKQFFVWLESLVAHIPIVKTLYYSFKDLINFIAGGNSSEMQQVVRFTVDGDVHMIGFVTNDNVTLGDQSELVSIYVPMSYMIGGFLLYLPKHRCIALDIPVQKAMQQVLTAHITGGQVAR